jgi:integrase
MMGTQIAKLTALETKAFDTPGKRLSDGGNLYLSVAKVGASKWWEFTYKRDGRQRTKSIGPFHAVTVKQARDKAAEYRQVLAQGVDPIEVTQAEKRAQSVPTFAAMFEAFLDKKQAEWRAPKVMKQARRAFETYCKPIARLRVDEVDTATVLKTLRPPWASAPKVAARLRGYIENTLAMAQVLGHIHEDKANPARWKGHLALLLPKKPKDRHFAALDYTRAPEFACLLRLRRFNDDGTLCPAAYALEFCILTAVRASEALGCRWAEIDLTRKLWTIPGRRTKSGREFVVPLSDAAIAVLKAMEAVRSDSPFVFPGRFSKRAIDIKAFGRLTQPHGVTTHGFRSSFRDFSGNETSTPRDICEMALAHLVGNATELAYRRDDALTKRRTLMDLWGDYLSPPKRAKVIELSSRRVP